MEAIGRPPMVTEEEEAEPDLRNENRLRQREQLRDDAPGSTSSPVCDECRGGGGEAHGDHEECDDVMRR